MRDEPEERAAGVLGRRRVVAGWVLAGPGSFALLGLLLPFREGSSPTYEAVLYLGLTVAAALVGGLWPALTTAVLGTLLLNFFFTAPWHSLTISGFGNVVTLVVFVVVSLAVASVVDSAARRRQQATAARDEADTLALLNRTVLVGEYDVRQLLELVRETFGAEGAELRAASAEAPTPGSTAPAGRGRVLVLRGRVLTGADRRVFQALATYFGVLQDREELARQTAAARELEAGNRTRTALLAAVSHDLRTPLAEIRAAAETLRGVHERLSPEDRDALLQTIEQSTGRLTAIITDLLDMSRLQTGAVQPALERVDLDVVLAGVLSNPAYDGVSVDEEFPAVEADAGLLARVLENLLANAVRFAEHVQVTGSRAGPRVKIRVVDDGPGVPESDHGRMFEPFQRLGDVPSGDGVGLGLAVARGLAEAQGGSLVAGHTPGGGLTMTLTLAGADA